MASSITLPCKARSVSELAKAATMEELSPSNLAWSKPISIENWTAHLGVTIYKYKGVSSYISIKTLNDVVTCTLLNTKI